MLMELDDVSARLLLIIFGRVRFLKMRADVTPVFKEGKEENLGQL